MYTPAVMRMLKRVQSGVFFPPSCIFKNRVFIADKWLLNIKQSDSLGQLGIHCQGVTRT